MRAARLMPGEDRLRLVDVAAPEPHDDEVLVRVVAAGVCRSDVHAVDGGFDHLIHRPVTLGHEVSGVVHAVGEGVVGLPLGTPVVAPIDDQLVADGGVPITLGSADSTPVVPIVGGSLVGAALLVGAGLAYDRRRKAQG